MPLSRNARRRLSLYGSALVVAILVISAPTLVRRFSPKLRFRTFDLETAKAHEASRLLVEYLRIDTTNPPGKTLEAVEFWARLFACEGMPYEIVGSDPERPIFVSRLAGRTREGALVLLHHMDTYPAGDPTKWAKPPMAGEMGTGLDGSYLYGRGAIDMKNYGVAFFLAMAAIRRSGVVPVRDIVFVAEPGEETFQPETGIGWVVDHRPDLLEGVTDVFNEGGINEAVSGAIDRYGIETLQKGNLGLRVTSTEREKLEELKRTIEEMDRALPYRLVPEITEFLRFIGPARGDVWGRFVMNPSRVFDKADPRLALMPDVYRSLMKDSLYTGDAEPAEKGGFQLDVVGTTLPGTSVEGVYEELRGVLASRKLDATLRFKSRDSVPTPRTGPAWGALVRALELDPFNAPIGIYVLSGSYTNSSWLRPLGYRCFGVSTFTISIYESGKAHQPNERIQLPLFVEGVERMERILLEFATSP